MLNWRHWLSALWVEHGFFTYWLSMVVAGQALTSNVEQRYWCPTDFHQPHEAFYYLSLWVIALTDFQRKVVDPYWVLAWQGSLTTFIRPQDLYWLPERETVLPTFDLCKPIDWLLSRIVRALLAFVEPKRFTDFWYRVRGVSNLGIETFTEFAPPEKPSLTFASESKTKY